MYLSTQKIKVLSKPPSFLILVAGFEERCLGILDLIRDLDLQRTLILMLRYQSTDLEIERSNKKNEEKIELFLKKRGYSFYEIDIDHLNPFKTLIKMKKILEKCSKVERLDIIFDVSGCIDGLIPILTNRLISLNPANFSLVYTKPRTYKLIKFYEQGRFTSIQKLYSDPKLSKQFMMTSGLDRVDFYEGLEGNPNPLNPYRIIFLAGFELNKIEVVCDQYSDSRKEILFGQSKLFNTKKEQDLSRKIHENLDPVLQFEKGVIENFNVQEILNELKNRVEGYQKENILICCFGTKPQLVASTIIGLQKREIGLVRVLLKDYHPKYFSEGKSSSLLITLKGFVQEGV